MASMCRCEFNEKLENHKIAISKGLSPFVLTQKKEKVKADFFLDEFWRNKIPPQSEPLRSRIA